MGVRSRGEGSRAAPEGPVHEAGEKDLSQRGPRLDCSPVSQCPCHPKEEGREQHNAPPTSPLGD